MKNIYPQSNEVAGELMVSLNKSHMPVLIKFCFCGIDCLGVSFCANK